MKKALIIDDSRAVRMLLSRMMVAQGYTVTEAGDGKEALAKVAAEGPFTVALVDWNMPVMTGLEFVGEVRKAVPSSVMKIIMVTTETEIDQVITALDKGADEYVMKPFDDAIIQGKLALLGLAGVS